MGSRFDPRSLEDYMDSKPIKIAQRQNTFPIQEELFRDISAEPDYGLRKSIGLFYEILAQSIFGGTWRGYNDSRENGNGVCAFKPDVVVGRRIIESKAVCWRESCKFTDFQMDRYLAQQCAACFMAPNQVSFFIPKYRLRNPLGYLKKFSKDTVLEKIVETLSQETGFAFFLPFSVVWNMYDPDVDSPFKMRYDGDKWDTLTRFLSSGIRKMLVAPEEMLESLGLHTDDYKIRRTRIPEGMRMNERKILPFPLLCIQDADYEKWLAGFREKYRERVEEIIRDGRKKEEYRKGILKMRERGCSDFPDEEEELMLDIERTPEEIEEERKALEELPF